MKTLSVVISAYNEEKIIMKCLKSVLWANEIIFVDNISSDKTVTIAKEYTKHIYSRQNNTMLNSNKNFGFTKATSDFILCLDADEEVDDELKDEIKTLLSHDTNEIDGYEIPRKNIIFGKLIKHTGWYPDYQLRLFKKDRGKFAEQHVHEKIEIKGKIGKLSGHILHSNYVSISQFISKLNLYTDNETEQLLKKEHKWLVSDIFTYPTREFVNRFFGQQGYKDGFHGLVLSLLMAIYYFIVYLKMWQAKGFPEEKVSSDFLKKEKGKIDYELAYWQETSKIKRFLLKLRRRI